jgi:hypothetical protein
VTAVKFVFMPVSIGIGLLAGMISRKIFEKLWGLVDEEDPPDAQHRDVPYIKLIAALLVEGAIFRLVRGAVDHGSRHGFARMTGTWPGEEAPEPQ